MAVGKKIILITGANSGIGFDTAAKLSNASPQYHVVVTARSSVRGLQALAELQAFEPAGSLSFLELDVSSDDSIIAAARKLTEDFGVIDVVVNNAGIFTEGPVTRDVLRNTFDTNTFGPFLLIQALEPLLQKSTDPRVINVSSLLGSTAVKYDHSAGSTAVPAEAYRSSKAAMNMLSACQQYNYKDWKHPAKVWSFCPGYVTTRSSNKADNDNTVGKPLESSETSAQGILEIIRGERDGDWGRFLGRYGQVHPW
ncbi:hypothetical protein ACHAQA_003013 [Verticillium albo-atrum]